MEGFAGVIDAKCRVRFDFASIPEIEVLLFEVCF